MNVLVFIPRLYTLKAYLFSADLKREIFRSSINSYRDCSRLCSSLMELKKKVLHYADHAGSGPPVLLAFRAPFGGSLFRSPQLVDSQSIKNLKSLVTSSPLHLPALLNLLRLTGEVFKDSPAALVFETSFFVDLPEREHMDALDIELIGSLGLRHFGYHGIFHQAACDQLIQQRGLAGAAVRAKTISICLEPRPEVAAVIGRRPVAVTSGSTPLEGLPGASTCGELDPSIVLALARKPGWGPDQINRTLTQESGLKGLTGAQEISLPEVFTSSKNNCRLAREIIRYRILLACGSSKAAMGGVETILFSGRYARLGKRLGPWLAGKLGTNGNGQIGWRLFTRPIEQVIAENALILAGSGKPSKRGYSA